MRRRFFSSDSKVEFNTNNYLTIEALEDGLTVSFTNEIEYGIDGVGWSKLRLGNLTPPINTGQTISFRGELSPNYFNGIGTFTISKRCNLEGNCMSLLFGDNVADNFSLEGYDHAFSRLFEGCTTIVNVSPNFLPATTLADYCYFSMFDGCTSLTTAPELPATTLVRTCYEYMFSGCTSLQTAPELPATTLASDCYFSMFSGCTSLQTAPELPATVLAGYCYSFMFRDCTNLNYIKMLATDISASSSLNNWVNGVASSGTFVKNSAMTSLPTGDSGIPSGWTVVDDDTISGSSGAAITAALLDDISSNSETE